MNKKGQLGQIGFVLALIFTIVIMVLVTRAILNETNNAFTEGDLHTTESEQLFEDMFTAYKAYDNMIIVIIVMLTIGLIISSFFIPSHPIFLVINILGIFLMVFIAAVLTNTYSEIANSADMISSIAGSSGDFGKMHFIMLRLPWIAAVIVLISTVAMYAKGDG